MPKSRRRKPKAKAKRVISGNPAAFENLPLMEDPTVAMVTAAFEIARSQVTTPDVLLARALPKDPVAGVSLDPIEANEYLTRVRHSLESMGERLAQVYPSAKWLWYTRRISTEQFGGQLVTTGPSDHAVFEALTGTSRNGDDEDPLPVGSMVVHACTPAAVGPVALMASIAVALSQCHSWLRRAGKGTEFVVQPNDLPEPVLNEDLEDAITIFDQRVASDLQLHWHPSIDIDIRTDEVPYLLTTKRVVGGWSEVPAWRGNLRRLRWVRLRGQFLISFLTLEGLAATASAGGTDSTEWWQDHTPGLVAMLQALWYDATFYSEQLGKSLPKVGYVRRRRDYAIWMIDEILPLLRDDLEKLFPNHVPTDGASVIDKLEQLGPALWPTHPGPVIRRSGEDVIIDIWAATSRLHYDLLIPPQLGGEIVNAAAFRFENAVQEKIDATSWRPSEEARRLTRGHLRLDGFQVTDIDAVAERDGIVLLVSCKNIPYSPAYDSGDYKTVRNIASTVDKAVEHWDKVLQKLVTAPIGDNYDVSTFHQVHGVVVTPRVTYSRSARTLGPSGPDNLGLRGSVSLGEFVDALSPTADNFGQDGLPKRR